MWWPFNIKEKQQEEPVSIWKEDFSDCATLDFLPEYSVCKNCNNRHCRYVAIYGAMVLCSNPDHKSFIIEGSEPFDPHKGLL
ncbi:MAG: hypothetical protein JXR25_11225 [Pontiellaceae bacterium]|nr:hypothetical protein [Pontiellaceae bacterium]MBN2785387.1 hypothetical protein [Pontiellaceae bacterium]